MGLAQKLTPEPSAKSKYQQSAQAQMQHLYHLLEGSGTLWKEGQRVGRARGLEELSEAASSAHSMAIVFMNSQQLWLPAQGKPVSTLVKNSEEPMSPHPLKLSTAHVFWKREKLFSLR